MSVSDKHTPWPGWAIVVLGLLILPLYIVACIVWGRDVLEKYK
jgi:hypothetical protein